MKITVAHSDWDRWIIGCARIAVTMLAIPVLFNGCSKSQTIMHESSRQTPAAQFNAPSVLLEELRASLLKKDEDHFLECFTESESFRPCLQMTFRRVEATFRFRDAVIGIYGEGGWDQFQQIGSELGTRPRLTPTVVPMDIEWWRKIEIHMEEKEAFFFNPVTQMTNYVVKTSRGWRIDVQSAFGEVVDPAKLTIYLKATTDAIEEMTREIATNKVPISDLGVFLFQKAAAKWSVP